MNVCMKAVNRTLAVMDMPLAVGLALESRLAARLAGSLARQS